MTDSGFLDTNQTTPGSAGQPLGCLIGQQTGSPILMGQPAAGSHMVMGQPTAAVGAQMVMGQPAGGSQVVMGQPPTLLPSNQQPAQVIFAIDLKKLKCTLKMIFFPFLLLVLCLFKA